MDQSVRITSQERGEFYRFLLPIPLLSDREKIVGILFCLQGTVHNTGMGQEHFRRNGIRGVIGQVFA